MGLVARPSREDWQKGAAARPELGRTGFRASQLCIHRPESAMPSIFPRVLYSYFAATGDSLLCTSDPLSCGARCSWVHLVPGTSVVHAVITELSWFLPLHYKNQCSRLIWIDAKAGRDLCTRPELRRGARVSELDSTVHDEVLRHMKDR